MAQITYQSLFALLERLGFEDRSSSEFERVFDHPARGIVFAFAMLDDPAVDRAVRPADLTSVEFRLQQEGLLADVLLDEAPRRTEN